jgi:hypothetical protein
MSQGNTGLGAAIEAMIAVILDRLPRPYGEDVIEDVFVEIERSPHQLRKYEQLCATHEQKTANQRIGHLTRVLTGYRDGKASNKTTRTTLAQSYTKLIPVS